MIVDFIVKLLCTTHCTQFISLTPPNNPMVRSFTNTSEETTETQKGKATSPNHTAKLGFKSRYSGFRTCNYCYTTFYILDSAYLEDISLK